MKKRFLSVILPLVVAGLVLAALLSFSTSAASQDLPPGDPEQAIEIISPFFAVTRDTLITGEEIVGARISGPPNPLPGFEGEGLISETAINDRGIISDFPSFDWVFGCSAVSSAMIAGYYDNNGFPNMYAGPTNGGVMPLTDTSWADWYDGSDWYPNNPLVASHDGVDGRSSLGSIDDYWVEYGSSATDPYITGAWAQHSWGTAVGDYLKTSQSSYQNVDGGTWFYNYNSNSKLTCSAMEGIYYAPFGMNVDQFDGTYGRKLFYEARGYSVGECYNQQTDNQYSGGFSLADFQAEINAGYPVLLNVVGHSMVGYGYSGSTIYIRNTWDSNPANTYTMQWGGSYQDMELYAVSVVHPILPTPTYDHFNFLPMILNGEGSIVEDPLLNGDFEEGPDIWDEFSTHGWDVVIHEDDSVVTAHGGNWLAWLGGEYSDTSYVLQTITISSGTPYLHYWYYIASEDVFSFDYFRLKVDSSTVLTVDLCDSNNTGGWVEGVVDLSGYTGNSRVLKFEVTTDSSLNSNFFLDDVSFSGSSSASGEVYLPDGLDLDRITEARLE